MKLYHYLTPLLFSLAAGAHADHIAEINGGFSLGNSEYNSNFGDDENDSESATFEIAPEFSMDFDENFGITATLSSLGRSSDDGDTTYRESLLGLSLNGRF